MLQIFDCCSGNRLLNERICLFKTYYSYADKQFVITDAGYDRNEALPADYIPMPFAEEIEIAFGCWFARRDTACLATMDDEEWFEYWNNAEAEHLVEYMKHWAAEQGVNLNWDKLMIV